jgi:cell division protein FtsN
MAKDYRRSASAAPSKRKQCKSCTWWLIVGVAIGVVASNILSPREDRPKPTDETTATAAKTERPPLQKPSFRFEEILTDSESDSGKSPARAASAPKPQTPKPTRKPEPPPETAEATPPPAEIPEPLEKPRSGSVVLQVGSFGRAADAERVKAQLALLGISASIQSATLSNGRVTHRVRTGAFASKQEAQQVQSILKRNGKDSLALPVK